MGERTTPKNVGGTGASDHKRGPTSRRYGKGGGEKKTPPKNSQGLGGDPNAVAQSSAVRERQNQRG